VLVHWTFVRVDESGLHQSPHGFPQQETLPLYCLLSTGWF